MLILASAIQTSSKSDNNNSDSNEKNNSLTLDCCCVLVQITPVAPGKSQSIQSDGKSKHGDGVGGGKNSTGPVCRCGLGNNVNAVPPTTTSAAACGTSTTTRSDATGPDLNTGTTSTHSHSKRQSFVSKSRSGSLDQLLFLTDQLVRQDQKGRRQITADDLFSYLKDINGDLKFLDKKLLAQLLLQNTETLVAKYQQQEKLKKQQETHHQQPQSSATGTIRKPTAKRTDSGNVGGEKYYIPNNIAHSSSTLDTNKNVCFQTKRSSSASKFGKSETIDVPNQVKEFSEEWFDRSQFARVSSHSDGHTTIKKEDGGKHQGHHRHLSGPSDLDTLKKEVSAWLTALPHKPDPQLLENLMETAAKVKLKQHHQQTLSQPAPSTSGATSKTKLKNEFVDIIRHPVPQASSQQQTQPQTSNAMPPALPQKQYHAKSAEDFQVLKNNILEWLKKQQFQMQQRELQQKQQQQQQQTIHHQMPSSSKSHVDNKVPSSSSIPRKSHPKLEKRHSLGPKEEYVFQEVPDWIQIPLDKFSKMRDLQNSCVEINRKGSGKEKSSSAERHRSAERKLRHSASEVVQPSVDRSYHKHSHHNRQSNQEHQHHQTHQKSAPQPMPRFRDSSGDRKHHQQSAGTGTLSRQQPSSSNVNKMPVKASEPKFAAHSHGSGNLGHAHNGGERVSKREKPRHRQTQRSATTGDILQNNKREINKQQMPEGMKPIYQSTTTLSTSDLCSDPMCPMLPICIDPNCYLNAVSHYDTPRRASLPRSKNTNNNVCTEKCYQKYATACDDPRCCPQPLGGKQHASSKSAQKFKSNSLPRCVETRRSELYLPGLTKDDSYSSLPKSATLAGTTYTSVIPSTSANTSSMIVTGGGATTEITSVLKNKSKPRNGGHNNNNNSNSKLIKSVSAASLNSRRRRHKTVHFGENLLREVCQNRQLIKPLTKNLPSNSTTPLQPNIQMLYNFVEGVLSAWVDEEDDNVKSGPESEPERGAILKPMHRCNRARLHTIRRVVTEAAALKGTLKLGNSRYRHRHWRGTAKDCNERFLRKVIFDVTNTKQNQDYFNNIILPNTFLMKIIF